MTALRIVPCDIGDAQAYVDRHHRHHDDHWPDDDEGSDE